MTSGCRGVCLTGVLDLDSRTGVAGLRPGDGSCTEVSLCLRGPLSRGTWKPQRRVSS